MANVSMKAKELGNGVMVCMSVDTKHLQDAIDKAATCAEGGLFTLYVQNRFRSFETTAGKTEMTRCALVSTCATAQAMASLYATVRTFKDGQPAHAGVEKTVEVVLQKEFAADIAACEGFPQVVIGITSAGINIQAQNAENDERAFFIALSEEAPARFPKEGGPENVEFAVDGSEFAEAVQLAAAGAYEPEKGGNLVSFLPEITAGGDVELNAVGFDRCCAARATVKVLEVSEDHEHLRAFIDGFCPLDAKRLQSLISVEGLKGSGSKIKLRIFGSDRSAGKVKYQRVDILVGENVYMLVVSSQQVPAGVLKFFGTGQSNVVMTVDVKPLIKAISVAEIGSGKGSAVTLAVENGGLRISDNTATHTAKCMKVKITSAPEGASVTCGTGMLKNALRAGGDSVELRFLNGGLDPIRVSTVKGWQVVFMPVSEKAESKEDTAPGENDAPEDSE